MTSTSVTSDTTRLAETSAEQLRSLYRQLHALQLAKASQGVASAPELDPRIDAVEEQIEQIKQRMAETKHES